ncbi:hypothetical protein GCM10009838_29700 [Catenulispora subtropica]|uniref:Uncharacterized protein n=1 Tax=Catenulispora subtropica TaxID=450798 RepID=A0ABN2RHZ7_9ACTN
MMRGGERVGFGVDAAETVMIVEAIGRRSRFPACWYEGGGSVYPTSARVPGDDSVGW